MTREAKLNEFDADEWFDMAKTFQPHLTREEFDKDWAQFQAEKAEHQRKANLQ